MEKAVIVIPTYNEKDSIARMADHLFQKILPVDGWNVKVLVVDGNSPDGTSDVVREKQKSYPDLELLVEQKKEGIGAAYIKGFKYAVDKLGADAVIEFDGDFQHPPETIPLLLKELDNGYDYILGSRRVKGGGFPASWGFKRMFFTVAGGFTARVILFFPTKDFFKVTDPTTGLKATRTTLLNKVDYEHVYSRGFGYKLEWLFKKIKAGAKVKEIPLDFKLREEGVSKITGQTPFEILKTVCLLRLKDSGTVRFMKFAIVGFIGFLVNAIFLEVFRAGSGESIASWFRGRIENCRLLCSASAWAAGLATELSICSNFILNNCWTFSKKNFQRKDNIFLRFLRFNLTSMGAIIIEFGVVGVFTRIFADNVLVRQLSMIGSVIFLVLPYNWFMYNNVIWKKKKSGSSK